MSLGKRALIIIVTGARSDFLSFPLRGRKNREIDKPRNFSYTVGQMARKEYVGPFEQLALAANEYGDVPVTSAPNALAICTAKVPTPPEAPLINTFCPA